MINPTKTSAMSLRTVSLLAGIVALANLNFSIANPNNETNVMQIVVNDHRPVAAALEQLERRRGLVNTYEDPAYVYELDVSDVTADVREDLDQFAPGQAPKVLVPKRSGFRMQYEILTETGNPKDVAPVVRAMLNAHALKGNPGAFGVSRSGNWIHVFPLAVKNEAGELGPAMSPLDVRITLPAQDRSVFSLVDEIWKAVDKVMPEKLIIGVVPNNLLLQHRADIGATNEVARQVLVRALSTIDIKLSWQLFYDPGLKWYALNIHAVIPNTQ